MLFIIKTEVSVHHPNQEEIWTSHQVENLMLTIIIDQVMVSCDRKNNFANQNIYIFLNI